MEVLARRQVNAGSRRYANHETNVILVCFALRRKARSAPRTTSAEMRKNSLALVVKVMLFLVTLQVLY